MKTDATILAECKKKLTTPQFYLSAVDITKPQLCTSINTAYVAPYNLSPNGLTLVNHILPSTASFTFDFTFDYDSVDNTFEIYWSGDKTFQYYQSLTYADINERKCTVTIWNRAYCGVFDLTNLYKISSTQYWKVRAVSGVNYKPWSEVAQFTMKFVYTKQEKVDEG